MYPCVNMLVSVCIDVGTRMTHFINEHINEKGYFPFSLS